MMFDRQEDPDQHVRSVISTAYTDIRRAFEKAAQGGNPLLQELRNDFVAATDFLWRRKAIPRLALAVIDFDPVGKIDDVRQNIDETDVDSTGRYNALDQETNTPYHNLYLAMRRGFKREWNS